MIVFLDLEETVIDEWGQWNYLPRNIIAIARFLKNHPDCRLGLMSWAVWNDADKNKFSDMLLGDLTQMLDKQFDPSLVWSMDEWADELFKDTGLRVVRQDLYDCFGKPEVLFRLARKHPLFAGQEVVLIDDAYPHEMTITVPTTECTVKFLDIRKLVKEMA